MLYWGQDAGAIIRPPYQVQFVAFSDRNLNTIAENSHIRKWTLTVPYCPVSAPRKVGNFFYIIGADLTQFQTNPDPIPYPSRAELWLMKIEVKSGQTGVLKSSVKIEPTPQAQFGMEWIFQDVDQPSALEYEPFYPNPVLLPNIAGPYGTYTEFISPENYRTYQEAGQGYADDGGDGTLLYAAPASQVDSGWKFPIRHGGLYYDALWGQTDRETSLEKDFLVPKVQAANNFCAYHVPKNVGTVEKAWEIMGNNFPTSYEIYKTLCMVPPKSTALTDLHDKLLIHYERYEYQEITNPWINQNLKYYYEHFFGNLFPFFDLAGDVIDEALHWTAAKASSVSPLEDLVLEARDKLSSLIIPHTWLIPIRMYQGIRLLNLKTGATLVDKPAASRVCSPVTRIDRVSELNLRFVFGTKTDNTTEFDNIVWTDTTPEEYETEYNGGSPALWYWVVIYDLGPDHVPSSERFQLMSEFDTRPPLTNYDARYYGWRITVDGTTAYPLVMPQNLPWDPNNVATDGDRIYFGPGSQAHPYGHTVVPYPFLYYTG